MDRKLNWLGFVAIVIAAFAAPWSLRHRSTPPAAEITFSSDDGVNLLTEIDAIRGYLRSPDFNTENCVGRLTDFYAKAFDLVPERINVVQLKNDKEKILSGLFETSSILRKRFAHMHSRAPLSPGCVVAVRNALRASRVMQDVIGEMWVGETRAGTASSSLPSQASLPLRGSMPNMLVSPDFGSFELRSGDVLVSRGAAFTSAAIARLADVDSNFSHAALYYQDPLTGEKSVVEAQIEIGSVVQSFDSYLKSGAVRTAVFRHRDPKVAHEAAKVMFERVRAHKKSAKVNLPYDFGMNLSDDKELFCVELVWNGFKSSTGGKVNGPVYRSDLNPRNRDFLDRLGIQSRLMWAPADFEIDPNFELVAEWRDSSRITISHMHDAVLTAMFRWMEREGYVLKESRMIAAKKAVIWNLRRWPLFSTLLEDRLPTNMSPSVIGAISALNEVGSLLFARLEKENTDRYERSGFWLTPKQMLEALERFRAEDEAAYRGIYTGPGLGSKPVKPVFHQLFSRP